MDSTTTIAVLLVLILWVSVCSHGTIVVSKDGSGDYTTVGEAIRKAPELSEEPHTIHVREGNYEEFIFIPPEKTNIKLVGDGPQHTKIVTHQNGSTIADIVFDYRQKVTRSFEYLQGDYYIAPLFMDKVVCHIVKNYIAHLLNVKVPLILGIWGGKGQGKSFQTELIFQAMGIEPVIMSAGELESERAGEPGRLIRERYRTASQVVQNQGKMSCLMINDIDAGLGRFGNTQMTVNNQIVVGTLMNLSDNPTRVSIGQDWRESDVTNRIPIIVTGNDFSTIYAPLIRDGRMDKFYWQPNHEDILNIVLRMYEKDGIPRDEVERIVDTFPNQALDFYGALRSRTYDRSILKWIDDIGGVENFGNKFLKRRKDQNLPVFIPPEQTVDALLESGYSLIKEQQLIMETKLSKEYMKNIGD